ncbi:alpha-amylase family glycosyl hydrolase [Mucilaginibacter limnophilus]|uniref:alpha-amylase family glycosyl hydrolase n=1 Tax=Mucilaginibacter limnophilus TaxID=1932778 RepID=UPI0013E2E5C7|nr:alpha-amylase family glycosyl hydrolase [Mucilaginibacter limnophilus]
MIALLTCTFLQSVAGDITLHKKDATIWLPSQRITGTISGFAAKQLTVHHNKKQFNIDVVNNAFSFTIDAVHENKIWVEDAASGSKSTVLNLTLGYNQLPVVKPVPEVKDNTVALTSVVLNNPDKKALKYFWSAAKGNPQKVVITKANKSTASVQVPAAKGVYYFNLLVVAGADSAIYKTYVTRDKQGVKAFNIDNDAPKWIDDAIIYQITPAYFVKKAGFDAITAKLAEIKALGVNTIYLQPVTKSEKGGQAYDVIDYLTIDERLGNAQQLKKLVNSAKALNLRVLLDLVPNHTSISHPYAIDCIKNGTDSHYFKFYQHTNDGAPYSSFYHTDSNKFVYYFWNGLVNLDYQNPEVQQWMIEICKYWLREFDIDGYRFDAVWGINSRTPKFAHRLRTELKIIKPDVLLLAEDKATDPSVFAKGFDAAYDWTADTAWISQWTWQTHHDNKKSLTIFNLADSTKRAAKLNKAIFHETVLDKPVLRFLENNDLPRFIGSHTLAQTKMAAGLLFAMPGIPMLFNGQEIGRINHPYSGRTIFYADKTIQQLDSVGMIAYYKRLIDLRKQYPALSQSRTNPVQVTEANNVVALHRFTDKQHFIVLLNLSGAANTATINMQNVQMADKPLLATDVLTNTNYKLNKTKSVYELSVPMEGYAVKWLLLTN